MNITIDRKVIEQALEALNHGITEMNNRGCAVECMPLHHASKALREALAQPQPVQQGPVARVRFSKHAFDFVDWIPYQGQPLKDGDLLYTSPQAAQPLAETQSDALNTLCKMLHSGEEVEGDDGLAMLVPMDLWNEAQDAIELLIGEDDGTEAAHGITKGTT